MKKLKSKKAIRKAKFLDAVLLVLTIISLISATMAIICLASEHNPESAISFWKSLLWQLGGAALFSGISGISGYIAYSIYSALSEFEY